MEVLLLWCYYLQLNIISYVELVNCMEIKFSLNSCKKFEVTRPHHNDNTVAGVDQACSNFKTLSFFYSQAITYNPHDLCLLRHLLRPQLHTAHTIHLQLGSSPGSSQFLNILSCWRSLKMRLLVTLPRINPEVSRNLILSLNVLFRSWTHVQLWLMA